MKYICTFSNESNETLLWKDYTNDWYININRPHKINTKFRKNLKTLFQSIESQKQNEPTDTQTQIITALTLLCLLDSQGPWFFGICKHPQENVPLSGFSVVRSWPLDVSLLVDYRPVQWPSDIWILSPALHFSRPEWRFVRLTKNACFIKSEWRSEEHMLCGALRHSA